MPSLSNEPRPLDLDFSQFNATPKANVGSRQKNPDEASEKPYYEVSSTTNDSVTVEHNNESPRKEQMGSRTPEAVVSKPVTGWRERINGLMNYWTNGSQKPKQARSTSLRVESLEGRENPAMHIANVFNHGAIVDQRNPGAGVFNQVQQTEDFGAQLHKLDTANGRHAYSHIESKKLNNFVKARLIDRGSYVDIVFKFGKKDFIRSYYAFGGAEAILNVRQAISSKNDPIIVPSDVRPTTRQEGPVTLSIPKVPGTKGGTFTVTVHASGSENQFTPQTSGHRTFTFTLNPFGDTPVSGHLETVQFSSENFLINDDANNAPDQSYAKIAGSMDARGGELRAITVDSFSGQFDNNDIVQIKYGTTLLYQGLFSGILNGGTRGTITLQTPLGIAPNNQYVLDANFDTQGSQVQTGSWRGDVFINQ